MKGIKNHPEKGINVKYFISIPAESRDRDLSAGEGSRRDQIFLPSAPHGIPQPPGLAYYTQGVTGHHILSVKSFTKDQVHTRTYSAKHCPVKTMNHNAVFNKRYCRHLRNRFHL